MTVLKVGPLMRYYIDNKPEAIVHGATVLDALNNVVEQYPVLKFHLFDSNGNVRRHINVFVNDVSVRELNGVQTSIEEEDHILLVASISGG